MTQSLHSDRTAWSSWFWISSKTYCSLFYLSVSKCYFPVCNVPVIGRLQWLISDGGWMTSGRLIGTCLHDVFCRLWGRAGGGRYLLPSSPSPFLWFLLPYPLPARPNSQCITSVSIIWHFIMQRCRRCNCVKTRCFHGNGVKTSEHAADGYKQLPVCVRGSGGSVPCICICGTI